MVRRERRESTSVQMRKQLEERKIQNPIFMAEEEREFRDIVLGGRKSEKHMRLDRKADTYKDIEEDSHLE